MSVIPDKAKRQGLKDKQIKTYKFYPFPREASEAEFIVLWNALNDILPEDVFTCVCAVASGRFCLYSELCQCYDHANMCCVSACAP